MTTGAGLEEIIRRIVREEIAATTASPAPVKDRFIDSAAAAKRREEVSPPEIGLAP